jgi:translocation and assembly module TamA
MIILTEKETPCLLWNRQRIRFIAAVVGALLFIGVWGVCEAKAKGTEGAKVPYKVRFEGVSVRSVLPTLKGASTAYLERKRPASSVSFLRRRAHDDGAKLVEALKSQGFYDAKVGVELIEKESPVQVVYHVDAGQAYTLEGVEISLTSGGAELKDKLPKAADLGLKPGQTARAEAILTARNRLAQALGALGYPLPKPEEPRVEVNHAAKHANVFIAVDPGPKAHFGPTKISGNKEVAEGFVRNLIQWKEGEVYDYKLVDSTRAKLRDTGLFSSVTVTIPPAVQDNAVPLTINLKERKPRTVRVGARYETDQGPGVRASWENRNVSDHGQRLSLTLNVSKLDSFFEAAYFVPQFLQADQTLQLRGRAEYEDTDAYKGNKEIVEGVIDRRFSRALSGSVGLGFKSASFVQKNLDQRNAYELLFIPTILRYDTRDNELDATKGGLLTLRLAPFQDVGRTDLHFFRTYLSYTQHLQVMSDPRLVLAGRVAFGSVLGAELLEIPPDERFYAGGGGSVRGYQYQYVSPLIKQKPIGGQSLLELSGEVRLKITDRIGLATFLDGGTASANELPKLNSDFRWGAGAGVRYFSPVGPFRLDFAVPLNPRRDIDDAFQIYLSMGQAF